MQRQNGFTLIELMITVVVITILAAVAYPSYQQHIVRGARSAGQQFLLDIAQRQEQFLLDQRQYATTLGTGGLSSSVPSELSTRYQAPVFNVPAGATPPSYTITLTPVAGGLMASDGPLIINNLGQRWRDMNGNGTYEPATDKAWDK
ncbi:MAG TPA: type IV pilin protein [Burkholderiales bacterium]|jgi:type IV pilus assembly protein PilE|nr:type IV pilin protein [Burkholderiales bacterium]